MAERSQITNAEARFNAIVEEHGRFLRQCVVRVCPTDLGLQFDDIEQEARLRLWRGIQAEREIRDFPSYIYRIAVTTTIDAIRQAKARREEQLREAEEESETGTARIRLVASANSLPDRVAERRLVMRKVEAILAGFGDDRRRAVGLHLQGRTTREIAAILGWNEPKARNLVYRGLADLREQLREEGIEYEIDRR